MISDKEANDLARAILPPLPRRLTQKEEIELCIWVTNAAHRLLRHEVPDEDRTD